MDYKQLWDSCLSEIESSVSGANFNTWFRNTFVLKEELGTIYLGVPNGFVKDWLSNKFHKLILKTFMTFDGSVRTIEYIITKDSPTKSLGATGLIKQSQGIINKELPLGNLYIDKESNLNPRYLFNNFIVGPFNELAHAAAQAIIEKPGLVYNPFFVYGGTGLGKTHLIQAIGNTIKQQNPSKKIYYTTLEKFATDYVNSLQQNKINFFKEKYRKYDVVIIDDIQFVGKMEKTQEELFHLFNSLYENRKQIVFSSDRHPNYIQGLEERVRSRFGSGMIIDINQPEYESRLAILKEKLKDVGVNINIELVEYLASVMEGNIRDLEGCLNAIICHAQLKNRQPTINETKNLIKNNIKPKKSVSIKDVVKVIADFYNMEESSLYEKTRRKEVVRVRQIVMYILREDFSVSYPLIGQKIGGKDHTTVIHSCGKIKEGLKNDQILTQEIEQIRELFK